MLFETVFYSVDFSDKQEGIIIIIIIIMWSL
jgi:hypothetical protein